MKIPLVRQVVMPANATRVLYSPKALLNFLGCQHSAALDLLERSGVLAVPDAAEDEYLRLLKDKGIEHEKRYLETLRAQGKVHRASLA